MDLVKLALHLGADLAGFAAAERLQEKGSMENDLLPSVQSVIVIACAHSRAALTSSNIQLKQYDTLSAYENVRKVGDGIVKRLEKSGHEALAIPAFIPIDMSEGKYGMVGAVDHRAAAVEAGMGSYGKSGLLLTEKFGPRVRLGCVLTSMKTKIKKVSPQDLCPPRCTLCLDRCPTGALLGHGKIDKTKCARRIFDYGLRRIIKFAGEMMEADKGKKEELLRGFTLRELWQNFMTGNYYYCFDCQSLCPIGAKRRIKKTIPGENAKLGVGKGI